MEVSTAGSSNSYASVLNPSENPTPKQKEITNDNNKENIPGKILTDKDDQRTADKPRENDHAAAGDSSKASEEIDESGFVPVVSHAKKDKKLRQMERRGEVGGKPKTATSKSQERPEKPKRNRRERKPKDKAPVANQVNHESSDPDKAADSSDGQNDKKLKFVEAPLPQVNPWVSSSSSHCR